LNKVTFGKEAQEKLLKGMDVVADAVSGTLGPKGRNVYLQQTYGNTITNDGFSIASRIFLPDQEEDLGAYVIRNVSGSQNDSVGDGTSTVAVLTQALIHACLERPENPMVIRQALNDSVKKVYEALKKASKPVSSLEQVALISSEDPTLAKLIADLFAQLGPKGVINVDDSKSSETYTEVIDGYEAQEGYASPYFSEPKTGKAILEDCPVFVSEKKISNVADIAPLFEKLAKAQIAQCVLVVDDIDNQMLGILVANKLQGKFNSLVIKAHGDTLKDIEGAVGATMVSDSTGVTFQNITLEKLGKAKKVVSDKSKTLFVLSDSSAANARAIQLEAQAENETNQFIKKRIEERIAQLRGGIAIIKVAAQSDFEREYLKLKAEDAIKAVQAAQAEGVCEGGGLALWRIAQTLGDSLGDTLLKKALTSPYRKIVENMGIDYTSSILNLTDQGFGPEVIDPTKVERLAVSNAVSAAGTLITSHAIITTINEKGGTN
jgi:chaperonin GroEL